MTQLTDREIRAAFAARTAGSPAPDLRERIHIAAAATPQQRGFLHGLRVANPFVGKLAFAALVSVTTVALLGTLIAGTQRQPDPSVPPVDSPAPSSPATPVPTPDVSPSPVVTPRPSPSPEAPTLVVDQTGRVVSVDGIELFELPTIHGSVVTRLPEMAEFFVIDGPVDADGAAWYRVVTLSGEVRGWLAAAPGVEPTTADCHSDTGWTADRFAGLGRFLSIACFGDREIEITGMVDCVEADVDRVVGGPDWLADGRYCTFQDENGEAYFEIFGMPFDELPPTWNDEPMTITGHLDDPTAQQCVGGGGEAGVSDEEAILLCRSFFHYDAIRPAG